MAAAGAVHRDRDRTRHFLVDRLGLLLAVVVTAASVQDHDGARQLLEGLRYHRLSKDCEYLTQTSEAVIRVAMIHLMVRRLARMTRKT